jgi:hypothetical protein
LLGSQEVFLHQPQGKCKGINVLAEGLLFLVCFLTFLLSLSQVDEGSVDDSFLDLLSKCQGHRLDDQRSEFPSPVLQPADRSSQASSDEDDLFETLLRLQGARIEDQRCPLPPPPKTSSADRRWQEAEEVDPGMSSEELFELIFACQVRISVGS